MSDKKISQLVATTTIGDADLLTTVQSGINKKITGANVKAALGSFLLDNGTDLYPTNPRGFNVQTGQAFKVNGTDVLTTAASDATSKANAAQSNAESYADGKFYPKGGYTPKTLPIAGGTGTLAQSTTTFDETVTNKITITNGTGSIDISGTSKINQDVTNSATPTFAGANVNTLPLTDNSTLAANSQSSNRNRSFMQPVYLATFVEFPLTGVRTVDGVTTTDGERVYIGSHPDQTETGIYITSSTLPWTRSLDMLVGRNIKGLAFRVTNGNTNSNQIFVCENSTDTIIGTDRALFTAQITTLPNGTAATTQSAGDNSTKLATTAYVDSAVSVENLWDRDVPNTSVYPHNSGDNVDLKTGGLKDTNVTTAIKLGDISNTSLNTSNKTIIGGINELAGAKLLAPVRAVLLDDVPIAGTKVCDGITAVTGDRIYVSIHTTDMTKTGIYIVDASTPTSPWTRSSDMPIGKDVAGCFFRVEQGDKYADDYFTNNSQTPIIIGTDPAIFNSSLFQTRKNATVALSCSIVEGCQLTSDLVNGVLAAVGYQKLVYANLTTGKTATVDSVTFSCILTGTPTATQFLKGASVIESAQNLAAAVNAHPTTSALVTAYPNFNPPPTVENGTVFYVAKTVGETGNNIVLESNDYTAISLSSRSLLGGGYTRLNLSAGKVAINISDTNLSNPTAITYDVPAILSFDPTYRTTNPASYFYYTPNGFNAPIFTQSSVDPLLDIPTIRNVAFIGGAAHVLNLSIEGLSNTGYAPSRNVVSSLLGTIKSGATGTGLVSGCIVQSAVAGTAKLGITSASYNMPEINRTVATNPDWLSLTAISTLIRKYVLFRQTSSPLVWFQGLRNNLSGIIFDTQYYDDGTGYTPGVDAHPNGVIGSGRYAMRHWYRQPTVNGYIPLIASQYGQKTYATIDLAREDLEYGTEGFIISPALNPDWEIGVSIVKYNNNPATVDFSDPAQFQFIPTRVIAGRSTPTSVIFRSEPNVIHLDQNGNDSNSGASVQYAMATPSAASAKANSFTPSTTNRFNVYDFTSSNYTDTPTFARYVTPWFPNATINGNVIVNDDSLFNFNQLLGALTKNGSSSSSIGFIGQRVNGINVTGGRLSAYIGYQCVGDLNVTAGILDIVNAVILQGNVTLSSGTLCRIKNCTSFTNSGTLNISIGTGSTLEVKSNHQDAAINLDGTGVGYFDFDRMYTFVTDTFSGDLKLNAKQLNAGNAIGIGTLGGSNAPTFQIKIKRVDGDINFNAASIGSAEIEYLTGNITLNNATNTTVIVDRASASASYPLIVPAGCKLVINNDSNGHKLVVDRYGVHYDEGYLPIASSVGFSLPPYAWKNLYRMTNASNVTIVIDSSFDYKLGTYNRFKKEGSGDVIFGASDANVQFVNSISSITVGAETAECMYMYTSGGVKYFEVRIIK